MPPGAGGSLDGPTDSDPVALRCSFRTPTRGSTWPTGPSTSPRLALLNPRPRTCTRSRQSWTSSTRRAAWARIGPRGAGASAPDLGTRARCPKADDSWTPRTERVQGFCGRPSVGQTSWCGWCLPRVSAGAIYLEADVLGAVLALRLQGTDELFSKITTFKGHFRVAETSLTVDQIKREQALIAMVSTVRPSLATPSPPRCETCLALKMRLEDARVGTSKDPVPDGVLNAEGALSSRRPRDPTTAVTSFLAKRTSGRRSKGSRACAPS